MILELRDLVQWAARTELKAEIMSVKALLVSQARCLLSSISNFRDCAPVFS